MDVQMPTVSVERVPVKLFGLGLLGFDHLQIVFQPDVSRPSSAQDDWFVIEGVRDVDGPHVRLGVEGWHGGTTLSDANGGLAGDALVQRIGTSESRGARVIAGDDAAMELWATLVSYAGDIEAEKFPYIPMALPGSPLPTINSSSLVASLLHHAGIRMEMALPAGLRFSPGTSTLLGTSHDDVLQAGDAFTTVVAGDGDDVLSGSNEAARIDKLYGGAGNDAFHWSRGLNIVHGGQPGLDYATDGIDIANYTGAGNVRLEAPPRGEPHRQPDFIARYQGGEDHLYSIEEIVWDGQGDRMTIGPGVGLSATSLKISFNAPAQHGSAHVLDLSQSDVGFDIRSLPDGQLHLLGRGGTGQKTEGLAVTGATVVAGSPSADRFVIAEPGCALTIENASPDDRLVVSWSPARVAASYDEGAEEAVIHLFSDRTPAEVAHVRVRGYLPGDLGLDITRPLGLAPDGGGLVVVQSEQSAAETSVHSSNWLQHPNDLLTLNALGFDDHGSFLPGLPEANVFTAFDFIGFE